MIHSTKTKDRTDRDVEGEEEDVLTDGGDMYREGKRSDTIGTVLVPWTGHFQDCKISCQFFSGFNMPKITKIG